MKYFHHRDHLKTIRVITDAAGIEASRTIYRAYGQKGVETGAHHETKGYIGQRHDAESGFLYLNARVLPADPHRAAAPDADLAAEAGGKKPRILVHFIGRSGEI